MMNICVAFVVVGVNQIAKKLNDCSQPPRSFFLVQLFFGAVDFRLKLFRKTDPDGAMAILAATTGNREGRREWLWLEVISVKLSFVLLSGCCRQMSLSAVRRGDFICLIRLFIILFVIAVIVVVSRVTITLMTVRMKGRS